MDWIFTKKVLQIRFFQNHNKYITLINCELNNFNYFLNTLTSNYIEMFFPYLLDFNFWDIYKTLKLSYEYIHCDMNFNMTNDGHIILNYIKLCYISWKLKLK